MKTPAEQCKHGASPPIMCFNGDHGGFRQWAKQHPDGYVLNLNAFKPPVKFDVVLHRITCWTIQTPPKGHMGATPAKHCLDQRAGLVDWATPLGPLNECRFCKP